MQPPTQRTVRHSSPKTAAECLPVAALAARARALDALDRKLRQSLSEPLRLHCRLAHVDSDRLVFLASSPAWASNLRFQQAVLLAEVRKLTGLPVGKFAVKVAPLPPVPPEQARRKPLSRAAAEHLKTAARSLTDPELRAAFLQLASLAEDSSSLPRRR
jgi:hypothetical protein